MDGVDGVLELFNALECDLREVGSLRVSAPDDAVGVLDGALFSGGVCVGVVDPGLAVPLEERLDGLVVEELAAVVGGDRQRLDEPANPRKPPP